MISPSKPGTASQPGPSPSGGAPATAPEHRGVDPAVLEAPLIETEKPLAAEKSLAKEAPPVPEAVRQTSSEAAREIGNACLGFRLRLLDRVVARLYDDALRAHELRRTQLDLLAALQRFGPATPAHLIQVLGLEKSSLSRNLRRLIKRELVAELEGADRRCHRLALTTAGHRLLADALPAWRRAQAEAVRVLGDESGEAVRRMARHYWQAQQAD